MRCPAHKLLTALTGSTLGILAATPGWSSPMQNRDVQMRPLASAGFATEEAITGRWQSVEFSVHPNLAVRLPDGSPWMEYSARRLSGERGQAGESTWASSRSCPSMHNTLIWMSELIAPRIQIAGVSPPMSEPSGRRPMKMAADGLQTKVWGSGTQPDHTMGTRVEMSSNGGLIAEFGIAATANMADCWSNQAPDFSR